MKKIIATKLFVWDLGQEKAFLLNFIFLFVYVLAFGFQRFKLCLKKLASFMFILKLSRLNDVLKGSG